MWWDDWGKGKVESSLIVFELLLKLIFFELYLLSLSFYFSCFILLADLIGLILYSYYEFYEKLWNNY